MGSKGRWISPFSEILVESEALRSERAVSVRGIGEGKGQPSTLIFGLASGLQMKCKNGRAAYYKMEQTVNEVFSFYLDRLLRGGHVPPSVITSFSGSRWKDVRDDALVTVTNALILFSIPSHCSHQSSFNRRIGKR